MKENTKESTTEIAAEGCPTLPTDAAPDDASEPLQTELYDLRVTVDRIEGRSVCGMSVGDYFELVNSAQLRIPDGTHFCLYALQAVIPLLPAKQRMLPSGDWLERDTLVCCPDPEEQLIMRIDRIGRCSLDTESLT
ncbi:TIGR04076 family protein [Streptomyces sp. NPDC005492]|uniref:TIGR04076 family protein n=1 Tax=Streptomyces sp. NPDC005492 TaxID=3156883 RepID=UPI0033B2097A